MAALIYSMTASLDGYISGRNGEIDWSAPDEELHRFHNDQVRELGGHILGRRLYETMRYWDTVDDSELSDYETEFARIWGDLPKYVFSNTLKAVEGNATLVRGDLVEEVSRIKARTDKPLGVGGAGLAAACLEAGLIDEVRLFLSPIVLGGGTPLFPPLDTRIRFEHLETHTFGSRVVYLRYERADE